MHRKEGRKGTPGKETASGTRQSFKEWHIQNTVRHALWLKRRGHVGEEKTGKIASFREKGWGDFVEDKHHPHQASGMMDKAWPSITLCFQRCPLETWTDWNIKPTEK